MVPGSVLGKSMKQLNFISKTATVSWKDYLIRSQETLGQAQLLLLPGCMITANHFSSLAHVVVGLAFLTSLSEHDFMMNKR